MLIQCYNIDINEQFILYLSLLLINYKEASKVYTFYYLINAQMSEWALESDRRKRLKMMEIEWSLFL